MKSFFKVFFITLGVIFFVLLLFGGYFYMTIVNSSVDTDVITSDSESDVTEDRNPLLSPTQEKVLETFGVDPADVLSSITPAQAVCFEEKLGSKRVEEIKAGDSPTVTEFFTSKGCI